jgi:Ca-activated chloride channel family protein
MRSLAPQVVLGLLALGATALSVGAQDARVRPLSSNLIMPQRPDPSYGAVRVTDVEVDVRVSDEVAATRLVIHLHNPTSQRQEAELVVPVPAGVAIHGFTFQGQGPEPTAQLLPRDEARRIYEQIVRQTRDPALLEFAGLNLVRSSVFPVEPRGDQALTLEYEQMLRVEDERVEYVLPRGETIDPGVPWRLRMTVTASRAISTVYSPSHDLKCVREEDGRFTLKVSPQSLSQPGPIRVTWLYQPRQGVASTLWAYPDPRVKGGYFLWLMGLPPPAPQDRQQALRREITLVFDRSGSMNGRKLEQTCEAARQIIEGLDPGDSFNIISYNESIDPLADAPLDKTAANLAAARTYLDRVLPRGGTNIHDALLEALRQPASPQSLPMILFLTDGLPTVGQTSEAAIGAMVCQANLHRRRIFAFGVGVDVNAPLLEKIANSTRGTASFVMPDEDVEVKVQSVFRRLSGPVFADLALDRTPDDGAARVRDLLPDRPPDLFEGDQLVVLGQYVGDGDDLLRLAVTGNHLGQMRTYDAELPLSKASTRHGFVPRLWAARRIAVLIDAVRDLGADFPADPTRKPDLSDRRVSELIEEIVRLSTEFGVLTEYTAFLAREGVDLTRPQPLLGEARQELDEQAVSRRTGAGAIANSLNAQGRKHAKSLNPRNEYLDERMNTVSISSVKQVQDRAFYFKGGQWVDSRLARQQGQPAKVIMFGTDAHDALVQRLVDEGRQSLVALPGDVLIEVDGQLLLVRNPGPGPREPVTPMKRPNGGFKY